MPNDQTRATHARWLLELTGLPTAAGREDQVVDWIEHWADARDGVTMTRDAAGNLVLSGGGNVTEKPLLFTAHLDHPAFVVERIEPDGALAMTFRGTVRDPYFQNARFRVHDGSGGVHRGTIVETTNGKPLRTCTGRLDDTGMPVAAGDVGVWDLPEPKIDGDLVHTCACDDLAAVAAAIAAFDELQRVPDTGHVQLLFTRAEEVGFIGATAACRLGTIPADARVIALENSRSFPESPIGGGPIVRVGDRAGTFDAGLTRAVSRTAAALVKSDPSFAWQYKLMPGGTCEATAFCSYGLVATCVCLPLGNYHNQADLARVESGAAGPAAVGPEIISLSDFHHLVALLVACGTNLSGAESVRVMVDRLYEELRFVLD